MCSSRNIINYKKRKKYPKEQICRFFSHAPAALCATIPLVRQAAWLSIGQSRSSLPRIRRGKKMSI